METTQFKPDRTRSEGRKIATWTMLLPEGKCDFAVQMLQTHDVIAFKVTGDHPAVAGMEWQGADIQKLRADLKADVDRIAARYFGIEWDPALLVTTKPFEGSYRGRSVNLGITAEDLHLNPAKPVGNRGETEVLRSGKIGMVRQRGYDDVFEFNNKSLDRENLAMAMEASEPEARTVLSGSDVNAFKRFQDDMKTFFEKVAARLGPARMSIEGVPELEELKQMIDQVAAERSREADNTPSP